MIASGMTKRRKAPWGATDPLLYELLVDVAITHRQLLRRHGLRVDDLPPSFPWAERQVRVSRHARKTERVKFVTLCAEDSALEGDELRHHAISAEARYLLKVPLRNWVTPSCDFAERWLGWGGNRPDAVWKNGNEPWAVEACAGSYSRERVLEKADAFEERFLGQLWACPTPGRAATLEKLLLGRENVMVMVANPFVAGKPPPRSGWWRNANWD